MNDYLTELAARALATAPAIVPRQGSLFEPAAASIAPTAPRRSADQREKRRVELGEVDPASSDVRPRELPPAPGAPVEPQTPPAAQPRTISNPPQSSPPHPGESPGVVTPAAAAASLATAESITSGPAAAIAPAAATASAARPHQLPAESLQAARAPMETLQQAVSPPQPHRPAVRRGKASDGDEPGKAERRAESVRPPAVRAFVPTIAAAPESRAETAKATPSQQPTAPPTIRITIGRVEVRAVAPPAAPAAPSRAASRPPRLSLEDYLKQRSGDRR